MEVLITILRTLQLRTDNAEEALVKILNAIARDPTIDVKTLIPPPPVQKQADGQAVA
jgi:hypothetical protein